MLDFFFFFGGGGLSLYLLLRAELRFSCSRKLTYLWALTAQRLLGYSQ